MRKKTKKKTKERLIGIGTIIFGFFVLWINCKFNGQILPGLVTIGIGVSLMFSKMLLLLKDEDPT